MPCLFLFSFSTPFLSRKFEKIQLGNTKFHQPHMQQGQKKQKNEQTQPEQLTYTHIYAMLFFSSPTFLLNTRHSWKQIIGCPYLLLKMTIIEGGNKKEKKRKCKWGHVSQLECLSFFVPIQDRGRKTRLPLPTWAWPSSPVNRYNYRKRDFAPWPPFNEQRAICIHDIPPALSPT